MIFFEVFWFYICVYPNSSGATTDLVSYRLSHLLVIVSGTKTRFLVKSFAIFLSSNVKDEITLKEFNPSLPPLPTS